MNVVHPASFLSENLGITLDFSFFFQLHPNNPKDLKKTPKIIIRIFLTFSFNKNMVAA